MMETVGEKKSSYFVVESKGHCFLCLREEASQKPLPKSTQPPHGGKLDPVSSSIVYSLQCLLRYMKIDKRKDKRAVNNRQLLLDNVEGRNVCVRLCGSCASIYEAFSELCQELEQIEKKLGSQLRLIHGELVKAEESDMARKLKEWRGVHSEKEGIRGGLGILDELREEVMDICSDKISPPIHVQKLVPYEEECDNHSNMDSLEDEISKEDVKIEISDYEDLEESSKKLDDSGDMLDNDESVDLKLVECDICNLHVEDLATHKQNMHAESQTTARNGKRKKGRTPISQPPLDPTSDPESSNTIRKSQRISRIQQEASQRRYVSLDERYTKNVKKVKKKKPKKVELRKDDDGALPSPPGPPHLYVVPNQPVLKKDWKLHCNTDPETGRIKCNLCPSNFTLPQAFKEHYTAIHQNFKYKCHLCPKEFSYRAAYYRHLKNGHRRGEFRCLNCNKTYTKEGLAMHQRKNLRCRDGKSIIIASMPEVEDVEVKMEEEQEVRDDISNLSFDPTIQEDGREGDFDNAFTSGSYVGGKNHESKERDNCLELNFEDNTTPSSTGRTSERRNRNMTKDDGVFCDAADGNVSLDEDDDDGSSDNSYHPPASEKDGDERDSQKNTDDLEVDQAKEVQETEDREDGEIGHSPALSLPSPVPRKRKGFIGAQHIIKNRETGKVRCALCSDSKEFSHIMFYAHFRTVHLNHRYRCSVCGKTFRYSPALKAHFERVHKAEGKFPCGTCDKVYSVKYDLKRHLRHSNKCGGEKLSVPKCEGICNICGKIFSSKIAAKVHVEQFHLKLKNHLCDICGKEYSTRQLLQQHSKSKHDLELSNAQSVNINESEPEGPITELILDEKTGTYKLAHPSAADLEASVCLPVDLTQPVVGKKVLLDGAGPTTAFSYGEIYPPNVPAGTEPPKPVLDPVTGKYICGTCQMGFTEAVKYRSHYLGIHLKVKYQCNLCDKLFTTVAACHRHHRQVHLKIRVKCPVCNTLFNENTSLKRHLQKGSCGMGRPPKPKSKKVDVFCHLCGIGLRGKYSLAKHLKLSHSGGSHLCDICGKAFKSDYYLKRHRVKMHDGGRSTEAESVTLPDVDESHNVVVV